MKRSVAVNFVLILFVFGLSIVPRPVRAQIVPGAAAPPPAARTSGSSGAAPSAAGAPQVAQAKPDKSKKSNKAATSAKRHRKLPKMVFVVTATRMEQALDTVGTTVSVVGSHQIAEQQINSSGDVLRQVPGVEVDQSGSAGNETDVSIRGSTAAQTLILMDGVDVDSGATGGFDLADVTSDDLDRVEVVRGAGGALYGSSAIGGVVNLITREGSGPLKLSYDGEGGNGATQRQAVVFDGADGRLAYSGALSYFSTTAFRPRNASFDDLSGVLRLDYHLTPDTKFTGFARYIRSNVSLVNFSNYLTPVDPNAHQRNEFMLYNGVVTHEFSDRLEGRMSVFFVRNDLRLNDTPFPANPSAQRDRVPDETRGTNMELHYRWGEGFRSLVGFDFKDRWVRSADLYDTVAPPSQSFTAFHARRQEYAGYLEQEGRLFDGLMLVTGAVRVDGNSDFGLEVSPSWTVAIPLERWGVTLRGSYSEGFRAPSFNELYFPDYGNPKLNPEISSEYDGGITKTFGEAASFTATYFSRRVHSLIVATPCTTYPGCVEAANAGRVDTQGVELVPALQLMRDLAFSGNLTVLDETHVSSSPEIRPVRVPKYSAFALLTYAHQALWHSNDTVSANLAYYFVGDRDDINQITATIQNHAAYNRFDLTMAYDAGIRWRLIRSEKFYVRVQNMLDRHYAEVIGFPSPPVNFVAGVKVDF
ncbi:MAG TPA: TonB-dependent receptor [Candidatus Binataceae bacterium]|nr:TonB-dependent receptor [Candidatus Binataceae bacterium]